MSHATTSFGDQYGLKLTGSTSLTSDYRFRGQTQTQNDPALQGSFTLTHTSGFYASVFASNTDFGEGSPHFELDPSIGYTTTLVLTDKLQPNLDVGVARYNYPGGHHTNYNEYYLKMTFADSLLKGDSLMGNLNYSDNWADMYGHAWNFNLNYSTPIAETGFGAVGSVGYSSVKSRAFLHNGNSGYIDYKLGVTHDILGLTAELDMVGTNIDTHQYSKLEKRAVDTGALFSLTKNF